MAVTTHGASTGAPAVHGIATRKAMFRLLPILCLTYFMAYVDRTNISLAKTHLEADVGISVGAFGLGAGLFFLTYALLEVPSNIIMYRVGPRKWIARIAVSWGAVTALMMFINNDITFYIMRMLLGAAEAGLYPAMMFMVTQWFSQKDRGVAVGYLYVSAAFGILFGAPFSGALLGMQDVGGLHGWQWMFLIEGIITIIIGLVIYLFLPDNPRDADWLDGDEAEALEDAATGGNEAHERHSMKGNMMTAFGRPFIVLVGVIYFLNQVSNNGVGFNVPSIIGRMNVTSSFLVGILSGVLGLGALFGVLLIPRIAKRMASESTLIGVLALGCAVFAGLFLVTDSPVIQIILIGILGFLLNGTLPLFWSVAMPRMTGLMAAAGLAFINTVGLVGGFVGPYIFGLLETRSGTPVTGFYVVIVISLLGAALVVPLRKALRRADREMEQEAEAAKEATADQTDQKDHEKEENQ
ncbi:MAG: MFS transporter [Mycobacteriaceae bacterium]|uniref:MFS transporter n=1 Tax=Corynebacterium sp. TaxID=1720 RepID=UPI003F9AE1E3